VIKFAYKLSCLIAEVMVEREVMNLCSKVEIVKSDKVGGFRDQINIIGFKFLLSVPI
jgi:hypothetical protein